MESEEAGKIESLKDSNKDRNNSLQGLSENETTESNFTTGNVKEIEITAKNDKTDSVEQQNESLNIISGGALNIISGGGEENSEVKSSVEKCEVVEVVSKSTPQETSQEMKMGSENSQREIEDQSEEINVKAKEKEEISSNTIVQDLYENKQISQEKAETLSLTEMKDFHKDENVEIGYVQKEILANPTILDVQTKEPDSEQVEVALPIDGEKVKVALPIDGEKVKVALPIDGEKVKVALPIDGEKVEVALPIDGEKVKVALPIDGEKVKVALPIDGEKVKVALPIDGEKVKVALPIDGEKVKVALPIDGEKVKVALPIDGEKSDKNSADISSKESDLDLCNKDEKLIEGVSILVTNRVEQQFDIDNEITEQKSNANTEKIENEIISTDAEKYSENEDSENVSKNTVEVDQSEQEESVQDKDGSLVSEETESINKSEDNKTLYSGTMDSTDDKNEEDEEKDIEEQKMDIDQTDDQIDEGENSESGPFTPMSNNHLLDTPGPSTPASYSNNYDSLLGPPTPASSILDNGSTSAGPTPTKRSRQGSTGSGVTTDALLEEHHIPANKLFEYQWPPDSSGEYYMLQEQISEYLGVKSFKRKYPDLQRRVVDMKERDFLREKGVVTETQCDLGLTAIRTEDVYDLMNRDYPDKWQEYSQVFHERQRQTIKEKHKEYGVPKLEKSKMNEYIKKAMKSVSEWNSQFLKEKREERKAYFDLQTFNVHYPAGKFKKLPPEATALNAYPVSLIPGQFQEHFKGYSPNELKYFPLNTTMYDPPKKVHNSLVEMAESSEASEEDGEKTNASSSGSESDSSSDSDSSSQDDDQNSQDEQGSTKEVAPVEEKCRICGFDAEKNENNIPEEFILCSECGKPAHPSCLDLTVEMVSVIKTYPWQCMECKTCVECMDPYDEDKMMFCDRCDRGYHTFCVGLRTIPKGGWKCRSCKGPDTPKTPKSVTKSKRGRKKEIQ